MDAFIGKFPTGTCALMFAVPVKNALVFHDAAAMSVDMTAIVIEPQILVDHSAHSL
jgi:hypothetical protein